MAGVGLLALVNRLTDYRVGDLLLGVQIGLILAFVFAAIFRSLPPRPDRAVLLRMLAVHRMPQRDWVSPPPRVSPELADLRARFDQLNKLAAPLPPAPLTKKIEEISTDIDRWISHPPRESLIPDLAPLREAHRDLSKRIRLARWAVMLGLPLTRDAAEMVAWRNIDDRLTARFAPIMRSIKQD